MTTVDDNEEPYHPWNGILCMEETEGSLRRGISQIRGDWWPSLISHIIKRKGKISCAVQF
jgi:hypothetical protein